MSTSGALLARLRAIASAKSLPRAVRYALATCLIALVTVAQRLLFGSSAPWFLYTPAVVLLTLFLRAGPGIWATLLSALGAGLVVVRPDAPLLLAPVHWAASLIFMATTLGLVGLVQALRIALLDADALRAAREGDLAQAVEDGRIRVEGPRVEIGARTALSFTLVLHELATNAIKYGSLSIPGGSVDVHWHVSDRRLTFSWSEVAGPAVSPPSRKGFGTRLIDTMGRSFGGWSELGYHASGVAWEVEADVDRLN